MFLAILQLLMPHAGLRGRDEDAVQVLKRLIEERELMSLGPRDESARSEQECCYCGMREGLVEIEATERLPALWRCEEVQGCAQRLAQIVTPRPPGEVRWGARAGDLKADIEQADEHMRIFGGRSGEMA